MSLAEAVHSELSPTPGAVAFLPAARQIDLCADLRAQRYLIANAAAGLSAPGRGEIRQAIDDAVEGALALRGAHPPNVDVAASAEVTVRDQVFRARLLGVSGLVVVFPLLSRATDDTDRLDLEDSLAVSAWLSAASPDASALATISLFFDESDRDLRLLLPVRLGDRVSHGPSRPRRAERSDRVALVPAPVERDVEARAQTSNAPLVGAPMSDLSPSDVPPSGEVVRAPVEVIASSIEPIEEPIEAAIEAVIEAAIEPPIARAPAPPPPAPVMSLPRRGVLRKRSQLDAARVEQAPSAPAVTESAAPIAPAEHPTPAAPIAHAEPEPIARPTRMTAAAPPRREPIRAPRVASARDTEPVDDDQVDEAAAMRVVASAEWRNHAQDLDAAKGPKPVAVIEKLFTTRYLPLIGAAARGEIDAPIKGVIETFRTNFEHSYREAYSALRVTGKRPPMVFDAPEIAGRIGRLNGARAVKLFLVDALRFDLGERVAQLLAERLTGRAVCVERMVMWAALPTTTPTQMALLSRGAEGLRDAGPSSEPDVEITRGRAVGTVRRERVGAREVMKLDLVEARIRTPGPGYGERMDAIAEEVVQITIRYIETLPPRTLLFLFGDHGFRLSGSADGRTTGPASQGGVSPEEVLVPGQAWLIGGVH